MFTLSLTLFFNGRGRGNILNNPSSGPHKIWLNSLKRKMTLTSAVLQSIMYTFLGEKKEQEDSYSSMQVTLMLKRGFSRDLRDQITTWECCFPLFSFFKPM